MKTKTTAYLAIIGIIVVLAGYGMFKSATSPGDYDDFADLTKQLENLFKSGFIS